MAASSSKLGSVTLLLLCGIVLLGSLQVKHTNAQMTPCPRNCDGRAEFMVCPAASKGSKVRHVGYVCTNCCVAENEGCILYDLNGTPYCQEEQQRSLSLKIATMV